MEYGLVMWVIIGAVAGWAAGLFVKGSGFGLLIDVIIGMIGALVGGWLSRVLGIATSGGLISSLVTAFIGAIILLFVIRLFKRG
jgi:uncharacterized membrane protein YeaQ/YmgE (transglycosylase-associated protein family)